MAETLGEGDHVSLLEETLEQEKETDEKLTDVFPSWVDIIPAGLTSVATLFATMMIGTIWVWTLTVPPPYLNGVFPTIAPE
jgi:Domain of unknown function (DUF892)